MKSNRVLNLTERELTILVEALSAFKGIKDNNIILFNLRKRIKDLADQDSNIIKKADENKDDLFQSLQCVTNVFNIFRGSSICIEDVYWLLILLELAKETEAHDEQNLINAIRHIGNLNKHIENE